MKDPLDSRPVVHFAPNPLAAKLFVEPLVSELSSRGIPAELWIQDAVAESPISSLGPIAVRHVQFVASANPFKSLLILARLVGLLTRAKPPAVEAHMFRSALLALLASAICRVPIRIYHNHGTPFIGYGGPLRALLYLIEWINCKLATHVLTVSQGIQQVFAKHHLATSAKCRVLGPGSACGIDLTAYPAPSSSIDKGGFKRTLGIEPDTFVVLYVGRPHRRKGFHLIVSTWGERFRDSTALLLLAGICHEDLAAIMPDSSSNIRTLGFVENLNPYYAAADAVALPSMHEGFGYALLEGAAWGCSLVASRIPGPDAIVRDGWNGYLITAGLKSALGDALQTLNENRTLCRSFGEHGRAIATAFSRPLILSEYSGFIEQMLSSRPA